MTSNYLTCSYIFTIRASSVTELARLQLLRYTAGIVMDSIVNLSYHIYIIIHVSG